MQLGFLTVGDKIERVDIASLHILNLQTAAKVLTIDSDKSLAKVKTEWLKHSILVDVITKVDKVHALFASCRFLNSTVPRDIEVFRLVFLNLEPAPDDPGNLSRLHADQIRVKSFGVKSMKNPLRIDPKFNNLMQLTGTGTPEEAIECVRKINDHVAFLRTVWNLKFGVPGDRIDTQLIQQTKDLTMYKEGWYSLRDKMVSTLIAIELIVTDGLVGTPEQVNAQMVGLKAILAAQIKEISDLEAVPIPEPLMWYEDGSDNVSEQVDRLADLFSTEKKTS